MEPSEINTSFQENIVMPEIEFPINYYSFSSHDEGLSCLMHWHKELELVYVIEGELTAHIEGRSFVSSKGEAMLINANEHHGYTIKEGPFSIFVVLLDLSLIQGRFINADDFTYLSQIMNQNIKITNKLPADPELTRCINGLIVENKEKSPGYWYAVKSHVCGLVIQLIRHYTHKLPAMENTKNIPHTLAQVNEAIRIIDANYAQNVNLDEIAASLSLSKSYFCRIFKKTTGLTFVHYLNQLRINHSLSLLADQSKTITDIAFEVGFGDSNYFTRVFNDIMKQTPSRYRKSLRHMA